MRLRPQALFCAITLFFCEIVSSPHAEMGISDDWSYIRSAQVLAETGHVTYNGWATAMIGWQLYLGALFIKLFGFSFTTVRASTLFVGVLTAFLLHRVLVRCGIREGNATVATLSLVLSPLFLQLSVTFMSDTQGLFGLLLCLYCSLRALQTGSELRSIGWIYFAAFSNVVVGSARQIAWLGVLVIVPSTLFLLWNRRKVFRAGLLATIAGYAAVFACLRWFNQQPYSIPEHVSFHWENMQRPIYQVSELLRGLLEIPYFLLPFVVLFIPGLRRSSRRVIAVVCSIFLAYCLIAIKLASHHRPDTLLEPLLEDWASPFGFYDASRLLGTQPVALHLGVRVLLTAAAIGGLLCLIASLIRTAKTTAVAEPSSQLTWRQMCILLLPFSASYFALLFPRALTELIDRYILELTLVGLILVVRYYQDWVQPRLPVAATVLVAAFGLYGIACTHDMFSMYRARIEAVHEVYTAGVPDEAIDGGWERNSWLQTNRTGFVNDDRIVLPLGAYHKMMAREGSSCQALWQWYPDIVPRYGIAFGPNECLGPAPFAPVSYKRWLGLEPGFIYVVRYIQSAP